MKIDEIEARAQRATLWTPDACDLRVDPEDGRVYAPQGATLGDTLIQLADTYQGYDADWEFLAHSREDVLALAAEVRKLRTLLREYVKVCDGCGGLVATGAEITSGRDLCDACVTNGSPGRG